MPPRTATPLKDIFCGAAAGSANVLALQPLDVVKTRLQGALRANRYALLCITKHTYYFVVCTLSRRSDYYQHAADFYRTKLASRAVQDGVRNPIVYRGTVHALKTIARQEARDTPVVMSTSDAAISAGSPRRRVPPSSRLA